MLHYKTLLLLLRGDMGKVREMFCSLVRFKGGLRGRSRFNSVWM